MPVHAAENIGKSWPAALRLSQISKFIRIYLRFFLHFLTLLFVHVPAAPHRSHRPRHPSRLTRLSSRGGESLSLSLRDRCGTERTVTKLFHYFHSERHNKYATHFYHLLSCHVGYNFITSVIFVETCDIIDIIICMSISTYIY